jgi:beta-glucanase (GH16 family)
MDMKRFLILALALFFSCSNHPSKIIWADEFNYTGRPDKAKWHHQVIPPKSFGWHNNELQHYLDDKKTSIVSDGTLKIKAIKQEYTFEGDTKEYISARLNSKFDFKYGRVDVRAKLPIEEGTWPAIWTLGSNVNEKGNYFGDTKGNAGWPMCGEIDIMEQTGWEKNVLKAHLHWGHTETKEYIDEGESIEIPNSYDDFHIYSLEWTPNEIIFLFDNKPFYTVPNDEKRPYDNPHYLLLNLAMGGTLGGQVPNDFKDATMEIDYVRISKL